MMLNHRWQSAEHTHRGNRRGNNEDAVLSRPDDGLWAVADGMGGHESGEYASVAITSALREVALGGALADCVDHVEDALVRVNDHLRTVSRTRCAGNTVGSTVVVLVLRGDVGIALWAGDSRLYRLRNGTLEQVTRDHNPVSDLLDAGAVSEEEAMTAETNVVTRAVGGQHGLVLDVAVFETVATDTFLLCSDGLYRELNPDSLGLEMGSQDLEAAADRLLKSTLDTAARDNVSLVLVRSTEAGTFDVLNDIPEYHDPGMTQRALGGRLMTRATASGG